MKVHSVDCQEILFDRSDLVVRAAVRLPPIRCESHSPNHICVTCANSHGTWYLTCRTKKSCSTHSCSPFQTHSFTPSPLSVLRCSPRIISHSMTVLSLDAEKRMVPDPMKASPCTLPAWPEKMVRSVPLLGSQRRMVLSSLPLAMTLESGEKHRAEMTSAWPFSTCFLSTWGSHGARRVPHVQISKLKCISFPTWMSPYRDDNLSLLLWWFFWSMDRKAGGHPHWLIRHQSLSIELGILLLQTGGIGISVSTV